MHNEAVKQEWLNNYPVGAKVLLKLSHRKSPATVEKHNIGSLTVDLQCREDITGAIYHILYGDRKAITKDK